MTTCTRARRQTGTTSPSQVRRHALEIRRKGGSTAVEAHQQALRADPTDPDHREGLSLTIKTRNPLYGLLLRFADWQHGLPGATRWLVLLSPLIAYFAAALASVTAGPATDSERAYVLEMGLGIWAVTAGTIHTVRDRLVGKEPGSSPTSGARPSGIRPRGCDERLEEAVVGHVFRVPLDREAEAR